ncbi:MAG: DUF1304 domain-containing protein [Micavibrio sp.]
MDFIASILIVLVAALHVWFLVLEMVLWQKPLGLKTFRMSPEQAAATKILAANQGLYNGFLAAGLIAGLLSPDPVSTAFKIFFLSCVIIAGLYGAWSVHKKIFFIQSLPALLALVFVLL